MVISKPLNTRSDGIATQAPKAQRASAQNSANNFSTLLAGASGAQGLPLPENGGRAPIALNQAQIAMLQAAQKQAGQSRAGGQQPAGASLAKVMENSTTPLGLLNSAQEALRKTTGDNVLTGQILGLVGLERPTGLAAAETNIRVQQHRLKAGSKEKPGEAQARAHVAKANTGAWLDTAKGRDADSLGTLSAQFESGRDGIEAIGYDRHGGTSYGKYQISSRAGTMRSFIEFLKAEEPEWAKRLEAAGPANTGGRRGRMPEVWKKIASESPERFEELQEKFIHKSHFVPAMKAVAAKTGLAFTEMPAALQEVLFSTAVQHGPGGAARIVSRAVSAVGQEKLDPEKSTPEALRKTGESLIRRIYALRSGQFGSSEASVQTAVKSRLNQEMSLAINMLRTETVANA